LLLFMMRSPQQQLPAIVSSVDHLATPKTVLSEQDLRQALTEQTKKAHLVLHFDINETILVGDVAGGDTREDCLNKILAKSAFVHLSSNEDNNIHTCDDNDTRQCVPTKWWDGTPICSDNHEDGPPPLYTGWDWPPNTCPYYRTAYKKKAKRFTLEDGACYRPLYHHMDSLLCHQDDKESPWNHLLPAFFHTLDTLHSLEVDYTLILRTFGSDLKDVAQAISDFSQGKHPLFPDFKDPTLQLDSPEHLYRGRWGTNEKGKPMYTLKNYDSPEIEVARGDEQVLEVLQGKRHDPTHRILGIQDDYETWAANDCNPLFGKPVWISSKEFHHLMLDDNIHNDASDGIVAIRVLDTEEPRSLSGSEILQLHGKHLVRVPTILPILNQNWFLEQIVQSLQQR